MNKPMNRRRPANGRAVLASSLLCMALSASGCLPKGARTATKLAFSVQPSATTLGSVMSPPVTVVVTDDAGKTDAADNGRTITLAIGANPGGAVLSSPGAANVSQQTAAGVATFAGLVLDKVGSGYTLVASASGLASATSAPFDIQGALPPPPPPPPAAPSAVAATAGDAQVSVAFTAPPGATSSNLYWGTKAGVTKLNGTKVAGVASPEVVKGLSNGTAYFFVVTALNAGGESAESSEVSAIPLPPPPPPVGQFGYSYFAFSGDPGTMTPQDFVKRFPVAFGNRSDYDGSATDIRELNPQGHYYKHFNLIVDNVQNVTGNPEGYPDHKVLLQNPKWLVKDANGNPVVILPSHPELHLIDFANDDYLDWVLQKWMPSALDAVDNEPGREICIMQDMAQLLRAYIGPNDSVAYYVGSPALGDAVALRYSTVQGVQDAWAHFLDRFKAAFPKSSIIINSEPEDGMGDVVTQAAIFEYVLAHCDGYFSESLTDRHNPAWAGVTGDGLRTLLKTEIALAGWLGDKDKVFFPNEEMSREDAAPSQADTEYAWAFFNLLKKGDKQVFAKRTDVGAAQNQPVVYPEMDMVAGVPLEAATEITPNVFRRTFSQAVALVNLSDLQVTIPLPPGKTYVNSLGQAVGPNITLAAFDGLTAYAK